MLVDAQLEEGHVFAQQGREELLEAVVSWEVLPQQLHLLVVWVRQRQGATWDKRVAVLLEI